MNLGEFLLARIDEQEQALDSCQDWSECDPSYGCPAHPVSGDRRAELDCIRQIVERLRHMEAGVLLVGGDQINYRSALLWSLRALALPYASHPDYREEWAA